MAFDFLGGGGLMSPGYAGGWFGGRGGGQGPNIFGDLNPRTVALFAMADKLAEAGKPQPYKTSTLGVLGPALFAGAQGYGAASRSNQAARLADLQLQELQRQAEQRKRAEQVLREVFDPVGAANTGYQAPPAGGGYMSPGDAFEADRARRSGVPGNPAQLRAPSDDAGFVENTRPTPLPPELAPSAPLSPVPGTTTPYNGPGATYSPGDFPSAPAAPGQVTPYSGPGAQITPGPMPDPAAALARMQRQPTPAAGGAPGGATQQGALAALPAPVLAYARANPEFAQKLLAAAAQRAFATNEPIKLGPGDVLLDANTRRPIYSAPTKPAELSPELSLLKAMGVPEGSPRWMAEVERAWNKRLQGPDPDAGALVQIADPASPTGFRYATRSQALGQPAVGPGGLQMEFGPDGRPTLIRSGAGGASGKPANPAGLAQPTINALEETAVTAGNALARIDQVTRGFKPEYQVWGTRGAAWWSAVKEKAGANLPEADRQALTEFSQYRRDSIALLNQTIKDITGAAMSNAEAGRITAQVPNPGSGVFDGDSPTEFKAKLEGVAKDTRSAILRANWARAKGVDPLKTGVELSEVPALINRRGDEIASEVKAANPQLDAQGVRQLVRQRLGREFGMLQ